MNGMMMTPMKSTVGMPANMRNCRTLYDNVFLFMFSLLLRYKRREALVSPDTSRLTGSGLTEETG
jgi:hypothetical protein